MLIIFLIVIKFCLIRMPSKTGLHLVLEMPEAGRTHKGSRVPTTRAAVPAGSEHGP